MRLQIRAVHNINRNTDSIEVHTYWRLHTITRIHVHSRTPTLNGETLTGESPGSEVLGPVGPDGSGSSDGPGGWMGPGDRRMLVIYIHI